MASPRALTAVLLATMLDGQDCSCSPCTEDAASSTKAPDGKVARVVLRNCGATTATVVAIYEGSERVLVLLQDKPVHVEWKDRDRLVVNVPAELPDASIRYANRSFADSLIIRRIP